MTDSASLRIGFIGSGQMATALARGLTQQVSSADSLVASDPLVAARERFTNVTGIHTVDTNTDVLSEASVIFLAVKPHFIGDVLNGISASVTPEHLLISIAAGVSLETMQELVPAGTRMIRVMPNTPCLVGAGACAFSLGSHATQQDATLVEELLSTVGTTAQVPEKQLDAITGLSGSGPAYVYQMIEALSDGGVRMGLPRDIATRFAAQTLLGASTMVLETGQHPGALKDAVTSPGGTTIAGLHALENGHLRGTLMNAVQDATIRSRELGEQS